MSTLTIAGLPVLAIIEDFHADATGNARPRAEEPEPASDPQTPGRTQSSGKANRRPAGVAEDGMKRMMGLLGVGLLVTAAAFAPVPAAANPACNALIAGNVTLTADMNCTASATHGLRLSANTTLNCAGFTITGPDRRPAQRGLDRPLWAPREQCRWHQGRKLQRDRL